MIRACLIGAGRMGSDHARHIRQTPDAKLYCVVDSNREAAETVAMRYNAKAYDHVDEALADPKVDAVVIVSSTPTHADFIMASARAGKPIFCEKPIDMTLEKTDACLDVVEEYGVPLLIGFNRRFDPSFQHLQFQLREGIIGSLEQISISSRDLEPSSKEYIRKSGGMFRDMTIHDFDMTRWLLQEEPVEVYAIGSCFTDPTYAEINDADTTMVTMKTAKGTLCHIFNCRRSIFGYDQRIEVTGEKGMLQATNLHPTTVVHSNEKGVQNDCPHATFLERYESAYKLEIDHFFTDVVKNGKKPRVTGEDGRQSLVIANAATESFQKGEPVAIPKPASKAYSSI